MSNARFLLIKTLGLGFWNEMHHVLAQLLAAELTQRVPVVHWGRNSIYSISDETNAFEQFFLPVSDCDVADLINEEFSYCPEVWNCANLLHGDVAEAARNSWNLEERMSSKADVLVQDSYAEIEEVARWLPKGHPLYGCSPRDLYSRMLKKYIRLRPEISAEIDSFYNDNMKNRSVVAVHIRGSDKITEVSHLHELNGRYPAEINSYIKANPSAHIFLMTDCSDILEEYKKSYGDILIYTDCRRVLRNGMGVHYQDYPDKKRKGVEIIKDAWLAARCDYFIGNGHSNVSRGISELKDWRDNIRLLY